MLIAAVLLLGTSGSAYLLSDQFASLWSPRVASASGGTFTGPVTHVVDGDTFDIRLPGETVRIRVCGIDAPERGEGGYQAATDALRSIIANRTLRCVQVGNGTPCDGRSQPNSYNRIVAQCFVGNADIATDMVRRGAACDWPRFSGGHYGRVGGGNVCVRR